MKTTERFTGKADVYEQSRPDYPAEAIACIKEKCGLAPGCAVADIGAGTGKFTRLLMNAGWDVTAIEPNDDMRNALQLNFPRLRIVGATAEATTLPDGALDAITVAHAFHWFDHAACKVEFARMLKPGGKIALLWNMRDESDTLTREHGALMKKHRVRGVVPEMENYREVYEAFFRSYEMFRFVNKVRMDEAQLIALARSRSYSPLPGDAKYFELERAVKELCAAHAQDGFVTYCYHTNVVIGEA